MDNSITLDIIAILGQDKARGICGITPDTPASEIERLHHGGFRGTRLSTHVKGYSGFDALPALAAKIKLFGWHVQLHVSSSAELAAIEPQLMKCSAPIVFDHLGGARGEEGVNAPGFQALLRVLKNRDHCRVKSSSWYRRTHAAPPQYANVKSLAQALVANRADRCVWSSNLPHPLWNGPMPNDGDLLDLFCEWVPDASTRRQVLVTNSEKLYGFV